MGTVWGLKQVSAKTEEAGSKALLISMASTFICRGTASAADLDCRQDASTRFESLRLGLNWASMSTGASLAYQRKMNFLGCKS